ncbi:hypothetical protein Btru_066939 [Bulinus truncatus]|nr:hypothetical protein Btru_066939 [Bulinus truncatus]
MNNIENTDDKIAVTWELQQNTYRILPEYTAKELKNRILFLLDSEVIEEHYVVLHLKDSRAIFLADNRTVKDFLPQIQYISIESKRIHPGNILIKHWTKLSDDHGIFILLTLLLLKMSKFNIVYSKTNENPKLKELPSKNFPNVILSPVSISLKDIKDQASSRNLADKEIKRLIRSYSGFYKKKWQLVLVTGDKDFLIDLFYLTKVEGVTTFLIHKDTSGELFQNYSTYSCFVDEIWKVPVSDDGCTDTKMPLMSDKNNSDILSVQQKFIEEIGKSKRIKVSSRNLLYEFHIYPFDTKDNFLRQISFLMISYNPKNIEFIPDEIENESFYNNVVEGHP